jgi:Xaa-Pro aminopeptidase
MTTSNEPGYYEDGNFGIRIENVCITVVKDTPHRFGNKAYCGFEDVTMVPIQKKLIDISLLNDNELSWLNDYHAKVHQSLRPLMESLFPEALEYLNNETSPILR